MPFGVFNVTSPDVSIALPPTLSFIGCCFSSDLRISARFLAAASSPASLPLGTLISCFIVIWVLGLISSSRILAAFSSASFVSISCILAFSIIVSLTNNAVKKVLANIIHQAALSLGLSTTTMRAHIAGITKNAPTMMYHIRRRAGFTVLKRVGYSSSMSFSTSSRGLAIPAFLAYLAARLYMRSPAKIPPLANSTRKMSAMVSAWPSLPPVKVTEPSSFTV